MKRAFLALTTTLLTACVSQPPLAVQRAEIFARRGDCHAAKLEIESADLTPGQKTNMMAWVYAECYKSREPAVYWATIGARYDMRPSKEYLARVGAPIPSPDLADDGSSDGTLIFLQFLNAAVQGYNAGRATYTPPMPASQSSPATQVKKIESPKQYDCKISYSTNKFVCEER